MKARKSFAFVLALMMILTLVPASAFAATDNAIAKVPAVSADEYMPWVTLTTEVKDAGGLDGNQTVKFTFENAEWANTDVAKATAAQATATGLKATDAIGAADAVMAVVPSVTNGITGLNVVSMGDNWIEVEFVGDKALMVKGEYLSFMFALESGSDAGDVKVKVQSIDSQISSGEYTVATIAGGKTVATVSDKPVQTSRTAAVTAASIEIRETSVNSVNDATNTITLTLPKGVTWNTAMDTGEVTGNMGSVTSAAVSGTDARDFVITIDASAADDTVRGVLVIEPIIDIGKDARLGNIDVQIRKGTGDIEKASGLTIAEYTEEGVSVTTVKEKDIPAIYAGYEKDGNDNYEVTVIVEENTGNSLTSGKYIDFEFPEWVQIVHNQAVEAEINGVAAPTVETGDKTDDTSSFEWAVPERLGGAGNLKASVSDKNKIEFTIPVTVEAGHSGDLEVKVTGAKAGITDTTLVVAKIVNPVTVEATPTDLKTGVQKQAGGKIVIKETEAGAIRDDANNDEIRVSLEDLGNRFSPMAFDDAKVEVTAGDLEIKDKVEFDDGDIIITVDKSSVKTAAEITISDIEITLDRTLPEGKYAVRVGGTAIVDNAGAAPAVTNWYNDEDFTEHSVKADYVKIITAADQAAVNAKFVIGSKTYVVNGADKTMDAEAYIDTAGRTMVPVRYIGDALGISSSQIIWNQATTTATLIGKQVVSVKVGDANLIASGTVIPMDTVAVNVNGRIYVPARFIATALGAQVDWDAATKTVSIYTVK